MTKENKIKRAWDTLKMYVKMLLYYPRVRMADRRFRKMLEREYPDFGKHEETGRRKADDGKIRTSEVDMGGWKAKCSWVKDPILDKDCYGADGKEFMKQVESECERLTKELKEKYPEEE